MSCSKIIEVMVGAFVLLAIVTLFVISFKASSMHSFSGESSYTVHAYFDDVGSLMVKSPIRIAGVKVGEVVGINLDNTLYKAKVDISLYSKDTAIPVDSSASIMTEGLLGSKYIAISPGFGPGSLADNGVIDITHPAILLENIIGKLLFQM